MKPRNKFDKKIISLNKKVKPIRRRPEKWALKNCFRHPAFRNKSGIAVCGYCGKTLRPDSVGIVSYCPHCHSMVEILDNKKRTYNSATYFSTIEIIEDVQVLRTFHLKVNYRKGEPLSHLTREVCRNWIDGKGNTSITGLRRTIGYYLDSFNWNSKIELRQYSDVFNHIIDTFVYPQFDLIPELKLRGLISFDNDLHPFLLMKRLLNDNRYETLFKKAETKVFNYFFENPSSLDLCWQSYKIAIRQKYEISDIQLWCDMLKLLKRCGKDIMSPKYICPADLMAEHDRWHRKVERLERIERERQRRKWEIERLEKEKADKEMELNRESEYRNQKGCYFGIVLTDPDKTYEISVLKSIQAFIDEAEYMHHCVFTNRYYDRPESIILSAKYPDGTRIETIEYSLALNKVIQCHGKYNQDSELHSQIIELVNANAYRFIEAKMRNKAYEISAKEISIFTESK